MYQPFLTTALKRMFNLRFAVSIVIMMAAFEGVARWSPRIVGAYIHQPYLFTQRICARPCSNQGKRLTWKTNGRGARGDLYHGQDIRIAVIGSSTTASVLLDQTETWPEQLKQILGPEHVHIENFARDGATQRNGIRQMQQLATQGVNYDAILIMQHIYQGSDPADTFRYSNRWNIEKTPWQTPAHLKQAWKFQRPREPRLAYCLDRIRLLGSPPATSQTPKVLHPRPPSSMSNRTLRNAGKIQFEDYPVHQETAFIQKETQALVAAAGTISSKVYFLIQPIAYSNEAHPGVAKRWFSLYPVPGKSDVYLSNRSVAEDRRDQNAIQLEAARAAGARIIDLDRLIKPLLSQRDDLFEDKWHFAAAGAKLSAEIIAQLLDPKLLEATN